MSRRPMAAKTSVAPKIRRLDTSVGLDSYQADELTPIFKMLSNPNRLRILLFLAAQERSVGEMESVLGIRQPTLSQQLGELRDAALIVGRRVAKSALYALTTDRGRRALHTIQTLAGAISPPAKTLPGRSHTSGGSQPAAVFAAVFAADGEALPVRRHPSTRTYRSERP